MRCQNRLVCATLVGAVGCFSAATVVAQALPFLAPGDSHLRQQVTDLNDADQVPLITTWPLPTRDLPEDQRDTLRGYNQPGSATDAGWFVSGAAKPTRLRTFSDTPRENGEAGVQGGWATGDYAGGALRLSYAFSPQDEMHYRPDGSYASWRFGNWWVTIGAQERWWGPGWDGSLLMSTNARPIPGLSLDRVSSEPFETPVLSWMGPWRLSLFLDHMENRRADFGNTLLWGDRFTFAPVHGLEIGIARTAEFCGKTRPCGVSTFFDMLTAKSNRTLNPVIDNTGNTSLTLQKKSAQRMATDIRWKMGSLPFAVYWQQYGEVFDSQDLRPRQLSQLFGIESSTHQFSGGQLKMFFEFADTACGAIGFNAGDKPTFGCTYEKDTWHAGYRYRGRVIGDPMDRDGRRFTLGSLYTDAGGRSWDLRLRHFDLNRGGIAMAGLVPQSVTTVAERLWNAEAQVNGEFRGLRYNVGAGVDHGGPIDESAKWDGHWFVGLSHSW